MPRTNTIIRRPLMTMKTVGVQEKIQMPRTNTIMRHLLRTMKTVRVQESTPRAAAITTITVTVTVTENILPPYREDKDASDQYYHTPSSQNDEDSGSARIDTKSGHHHHQHHRPRHRHRHPSTHPPEPGPSLDDPWNHLEFGNEFGTFSQDPSETPMYVDHTVGIQPMPAYGEPDDQLWSQGHAQNLMTESDQDADQDAEDSLSIQSMPLYYDHDDRKRRGRQSRNRADHGADLQSGQQGSNPFAMAYPDVAQNLMTRSDQDAEDVVGMQMPVYYKPDDRKRRGLQSRNTADNGADMPSRQQGSSPFAMAYPGDAQWQGWLYSVTPGVS
jgi:hypothetical protein